MGSGSPKGSLMSYYDLSPEAHIGGREPTTDKTSVVSMHRWVLRICVSCWMLQPSTETVIANTSVPLDFLVDGQVIGLGTVHPLLTSNFFSTWLLLLEKRKTSFIMDGLQKRISPS